VAPETWRPPVCSPSEISGHLRGDRKQDSATGKGGFGTMSRKTLVALLLVIASALSAVALFGDDTSAMCRRLFERRGGQDPNPPRQPAPDHGSVER